MLQQCYISGFECQTFRLLDTDLHPLTLGHIQCLAMLESALPFPPVVKLTHADVASVYFVCAFPDFRDALKPHDGWRDAAIDRINKSSAEKLRECSQVVLAYLGYYLSHPMTNKSAEMWADARTPWWWSYAEFMQSVMGRTEIDAWNTVVCDAMAYHACHAVRHGSTDVTMHREIVLRGLIEKHGSVANLFEKGLL